MDTQAHPTHKRETQIGVALLSLPGVAAGALGLAGLLRPLWVVAGLGVSALLLLPWILWRNTRCQCPQCGSWLRIDRRRGRPPGGAQLFECDRCQVLWDDGMERDGA